MTSQCSSHARPAHSRRAILGAGGAITSALLTARRAGAQAATPVTSSGEVLFVQSFGSGSLFRTQGSGPDLPPYTLYLWDTAAHAMFVTELPELSTGLILTEQALSLITAAVAEAPAAILVAPTEGSVTEGAEAVWGLRLAFAGAGSDPDSLTYQGDLLTPTETGALLARPMSTPVPEGEQGLGSGSLFIIGVPAQDLDAVVQLRLP